MHGTRAGGGQPVSDGKVWTDPEVETLIQMWNAGAATSDIAKKLGRNDNSVAIKASRLRLPRKTDVKNGELGGGRKMRPDAKIRPCMTCRRPFFSEGNHNRRCDPCRESDDGGDMDYVVEFTGRF